MQLPGFGAEQSLGPSTRTYRVVYQHRRHAAHIGVVPTQIEVIEGAAEADGTLMAEEDAATLAAEEELQIEGGEGTEVLGEGESSLEMDEDLPAEEAEGVLIEHVEEA